jgi:hypothetical protein
MIIPFALTVPADTPASAPEVLRTYVSGGSIKTLLWVMPLGCNDMVKARLFVNETQIMPILSDTWLAGNGVMGPFDEDIALPPGGAYLQLVACSPETTYRHTITVYVGIVQEGAGLDDVVAALQRMAAGPYATEEEIIAEGERRKDNEF